MRNNRPIFMPLLILLAAVLAAIPARGLDKDREFEFASGLIEIGFADFADKVLEQILQQFPGEQDRAKLFQAEILIKRGKFADAAELVKTMAADNPKAQAISLALARGYHRNGDMDKARQLYSAFFDQYKGRIPTDPDLLRFYQDSAYQFGQMLEQDGDLQGAIDAYSRIVATTTDRTKQRQIWADQSQLYVNMAGKETGEARTKHLDEAYKLSEKVLWGGTDLPFGNAIISMANISLLKGDKAGAEKLLREKLTLLKEVDTWLEQQGYPLKLSPMAGARFLLGELYQQQADAVAGNKEKAAEALDLYGKALNQFYNVFAKYGDSSWGPQAGLRAQDIKTKIEKDYGRKVNVDFGAMQDGAIAAQFNMADNLFLQKKFGEAVTEYLKVLNQFPETGASVNALNNLTLAYAHQSDLLMVKAMIAYLGERFRSRDQAALGLMSLGKLYLDQTNQPMAMLAYNTFLDSFPKHEKCGLILFFLADLRKKAGDDAGALALYRRIVENYPQDAYYPKALSQLAWGAYMAGEYSNAIPGFVRYLAEAQPGPDKARGQFCLAESYRQTGQFIEAVKAYQALISWLSAPNNPYGISAKDIAQNKDLLEKAVFQMGYSFAKATEPAASIADFRQRAIKTYDYFIATFPQSSLAAKALRMKSSVQFETGDYAGSTRTAEELASRYPESEEAHSARFSQVISAIEIKQWDKARDAFAKMLEKADTFTLDDFTLVGQQLLDAGLDAEAVKAFERVKGGAQDRRLLERALFGLGSAQFAQTNYEAAGAALGELMQKYPQSGLLYDAKFMMGTAYREVGRTADAIGAMGDVIKYATNNVLLNKASFELGQIHKKGGAKPEALAAFQRVALLAKPSDPELRPIIEQCILESIALYMDLGRYADAEESCDQYLNIFAGSAKVDEVRRTKAEAKVKGAEAAARKAAAAAAAPGTP